MNPTCTRAENEQAWRLPDPPTGTHWHITKELLLIAAHDFNQPESWRRQVYKDHYTEQAAARTRCSDGRTIKEIIDNLVLMELCMTYTQKGAWIVVKGYKSSYTLRADYLPYFKMVVRMMNPFEKGD